MSTSRDITEMLRQWSDGDKNVVDDLLPLVHMELRRQAAYFLRGERPNHTLQTTALINEAYLKLIGQRNPKFEDRIHFFAFSASLMRRILIDYARMKGRKKRGGNSPVLTLDEARDAVSSENDPVDLIALDQALTGLAQQDARQARIVELRYFGGLTLDETADALGVSRSLVAQEWSIAKSWLYRELTR